MVLLNIDKYKGELE